MAFSLPCGSCALCGNYGGHTKSMVPSVNSFTAESKRVSLSAPLNCSDYGIYVAVCKNCRAAYVGKTRESFSSRWNQHRMDWNHCECSRRSNCPALKHHYHEHHPIIFRRKPDLAECYSVYFVEQPAPRRIDCRERDWINDIGSSINIQRPSRC
ncbi:unnamed protein product [Clavelina lepadiformis]|uniref:GIY-YIG domain-containing protein n=1 Tax=Clavelina lepadiformis TaxID=159417 RepID=A0ABP0FPL5_CLALP